MSIFPRSASTALVLVVVGGLAAAAFGTRQYWLDLLPGRPRVADAEEAQAPPPDAPKMLELSAAARRNLLLVSKPALSQTYWRTIQVPGVIVDQPGLSDRGVTAPAVGIVARVHAFPGDTVKAGDRLFTLRLSSEYLQNSQSELFKTTREMQLAQAQYDRLLPSVKSGALPDVKLIEVDNQLRRMTAAVQAYRQDLLTRGLTTAQIDNVAAGKFVSEIEVVAPPPQADDKQLVSIQQASLTPAAGSDIPVYEVQDLKAELGQQVQAGQLLCTLANHQALYIEGHSFQREAPFLEKAARNGWPVRVRFGEDHKSDWLPLKETFTIRHLANALDPGSRTFDFYVPLANQSRAYEKNGRTFLVWRFRPGQHVHLQVPVEEFKDVIALPAAAVVREGPEAYAFVQNGDLFERHSVHVLYEDRVHVVLANDGSVTPGAYLAQGAAASLNRVLKAQNSSSGLPPGAHFHADGSLHIPGQ